MIDSVFFRLVFCFGLFILVQPLLAQKKEMYSNFPEKFETTEIKDQYSTSLVSLNSGSWSLDGVKLMKRKRGVLIKDDGTKGLVFISKNNSAVFAEMQFDLPNGASKFQVDYSSYAADPTCQWQLEMSVGGQGKVWNRVGKVVLVDNKLPETAEFLLDVNVPVRFRIVKLGLGGKDDPSIHNGRLVIDNIRIYKNK